MSYAKLMKELDLGVDASIRGSSKDDAALCRFCINNADDILSALAIAAALEERLIGNNYVYMRGIGEAIKERAAELRRGAK